MKLNLTELREARGWSKSELARRSGIAVSHISNIEYGLKDPSATVLCKLAKALDVSVADLLDCEN